MGYTTNFSGEFTITPALSEEHRAYLGAFSEVRHMARDEKITEGLPDPIREKVELPIGHQGAYYVGDATEGILTPNYPTETQPGLWCQWVPSSDGSGLAWDEGEKFYRYIEWLEYLIKFLEMWGYKLNGEVYWEGEVGATDMGRIACADNVVTVADAQVTYVDR